MHVEYLLQVPFILSYIPPFLTQPAALQFSNRNFLYSFVNSHIHVTRTLQLVTTLCSVFFFAMLLLVLFGSMLLCRFYSHIPCPSFNIKKAPLCSVLGPFVIQPKFSDFVSYQFVHFILNLNIFQ